MAQAMTQTEGVRELARSLACECKVAAKAFGEAAASLRAFAHRHKEVRGWPLLCDVGDWLEAAEKALGNVSRAADAVFEATRRGSTEG